MDVFLPDAVIRTSDEFAPKYRRLIRTLIEIAVRNGAFHKRDKGWLDEAIERNEARGFINNGKVTGFCVLRQISHKEIRCVYAEACLWKEQYRRQTQYMLIDEARKIGDSMYGAFYSTNAIAKEFYTVAHGYQHISHEQLPLPILQEVSDHLSEITLLHNPLHSNKRDHLDTPSSTPR